MRLAFDHQSIKLAAGALRDGKLVSFATETVYGLGADATNDKAVAAIYAAKGRPSFNPLIAHIAAIEQAEAIAEMTPLAYAAADVFWPGALTLIVPLKKEAGISKLVTAGLDTIALRMPSSEKVRHLLAEAGRPIAAPSANPSGRISPTLASHVEATLGDACAYILDDGACRAGLESTILDCTSDRGAIMRPGPITSEMLQAQLDGFEITQEVASNDINPTAPGQMTSHYAPSKQLRLNATSKAPDEILIGFGDVPDADLNLSADGDVTEAAANLFAMLHEADRHKGRAIAISPLPQAGLGRAIHDRLYRAAIQKSE